MPSVLEKVVHEKRLARDARYRDFAIIGPNVIDKRQIQGESCDIHQLGKLYLPTVPT